MDPTNSKRARPGFLQDSTNLLLIAIIIVIVLLIGGIYVLITRAHPKTIQKVTTSHAQPPPIVISLSPQMKTYTNSLGYSIRYPENLTPNENAIKRQVEFKYSSEENSITLLTVTIIPTPFKNSPTTNRTTDGINYVTDWKEITVNGKTGHRYIRNPCPKSCPMLSVDLPFSNGTEILSITSSNTGTKLFDEIISHITYTK